MMLLALVAGCGGDPCGGPRPSLASCEVGLFRADCGGSGPATFACDPVSGQQCRWFATACVAREFLASDCGYGDPCCHGSPGHSWPFESGWTASDSAGAVEDIAACGSEPVTDHRPAPIDVTVDPAVSPTVPSRVVCDSAVRREFCAAPSLDAFASGDGALTLRAEGAPLNAEAVLLEIIHVDETGLGARVFTRTTTEVGMPYCEAARTPHLRFTGSVTLDTGDLSDPSRVHGRADLLLDGAPVVFSF